MNDLETYFRTNSNKRLIQKWIHYFDIYDRHFRDFRDKEPVILEIGVFQGGSLQMWKNYFGRNAKIYGLDINPQCKQFEEENITVLTGSQSDRDFLRQIKEQIPPIDILIDDGGHTMNQQIVTLEELFEHVKPNGIYLCEDIHTSYWLKYGGGHKRRGTFIEYIKGFIDQLNAFHSEQRSLKVNSVTRSVNSIHFYDSIVVIEKGRREKPHEETSGTASYEEKIMVGKFRATLGRIKRSLLLSMNRVLRFFNIRNVFLR
jgi:hypothetical protein